MKGKSIKGKSPEEIRSALHQRMKEDGFHPTLAIVFISVKQDRNAVCEILHQEGIDIVGATTCGLFTNGFHDGYEGEGSTVILLLDIPRDAYKILFEDVHQRDLSDVASELAHAAFQKFTKPAIILCSTGVSITAELFAGNELMDKLAREVGPEVKIFGGLAGDDMQFTGSYVFTHGLSSDVGIVALILDQDRISVQGMAISGWQALGISRTVTKCVDGWVYTIDNQPALDMYLRYLGKPISGENKYDLFEHIGVLYPFQAEGIGDPVMRTPILIDKEKGALKLDFDMPEGTQFRFSMPPDFDIVENVLENAADLRKVSQADAEALLIFSCAGRLSALGPMTNRENEGLSEVWNAPMAGFFTYGEYGTTQSKQEFHSTTCCWVALREK